MDTRLTVTDLGKNLITELIAGQSKLTFNELLLSEHDYGGIQLETLTEITDIKQRVFISDVKIKNKNIVEFKAAVDNAELMEGYYIRALGITVLKEDGSEVLLAASADSLHPDYLPTIKEKTMSGISYNFEIAVDDTAVINLIVNPAATPTIDQVKALEDGKVDKDPTRGLSTNDFTEYYKRKLDNLDGNLEGKVDKVIGKQLTTNDFTNADKEKLDGMSNDVEAKIATKVDKVEGMGLSNNNFTNEYKNMLDNFDANVVQEMEKLSEVQDDCVHDLAATIFELKQKDYIEGGGIDNVIVDTIDKKSDVDLKSGNFDTDKKRLYI